MSDVERPNFRPLQKQGNVDAIGILEALLAEAREGKLVGLAAAVDYGDHVRAVQTASDNGLQLLAAVNRLHHKMQMWCDQEYPD